MGNFKTHKLLERITLTPIRDPGKIILRFATSMIF